MMIVVSLFILGMSTLAGRGIVGAIHFRKFFAAPV